MFPLAVPLRGEEPPVPEAPAVHQINSGGDPMSRESAHEFFARTVHDGALQSRLATVPQGDWEGLRSVAQEAGFEPPKQP
jgi:hypothetical protein